MLIRSRSLLPRLDGVVVGVGAVVVVVVGVDVDVVRGECVPGGGGAGEVNIDRINE